MLQKRKQNVKKTLNKAFLASLVFLAVSSASLLGLFGFVANNTDSSTQTTKYSFLQFNRARTGTKYSDKLDIQFNFLQFEAFLIWHQNSPRPQAWNSIPTNELAWANDLSDYPGQTFPSSATDGLGNNLIMPATPDPVIGPNPMRADNNLYQLNQWLSKQTNSDNTTNANIRITADCVSCANPPTDGEQLATFSLNPNYYNVPNGEYANGAYQRTTGKVNPIINQNFTLNYRSQYRLSIILDVNSGSSASDGGINKSQMVITDGWLNTNIANQFKDYLDPSLYNPVLTDGAYFRYPVFWGPSSPTDGWLGNVPPSNDEENINTSSSNYFNLWTQPNTTPLAATMGAISIAFIIVGTVVILALFTPAYIRAIRRW